HPYMTRGAKAHIAFVTRLCKSRGAEAHVALVSHPCRSRRAEARVAHVIMFVQDAWQAKSRSK
ncbi:hypothetical protein A2U01_0077251, partial [Trifolium medium]|nr:hypothetical protein [Trifolium medium]